MFNFQKSGGGGSRFHFPLSVFQRAPGATQESGSAVWYQDLGNWFWFYEDFLWDAFDIDEHPLALYDASASGTPTTGLVADATGGAYQIQLASTNESETVGFTLNDNLYIQGNKPFLFLTRLKVVNTMAANQNIVWGLASDVNTNTLDNITRNCWFRLAGAADLLVETDDNTNDRDDQDTGFDVVADTYNWYGIERGMDGTVYFRKADGDGQNRKSWTMSGKFGLTEPSFGANNLQPVILAQKTTGTTQPEVVIDAIAFAGMRA